MNPSVLKLWLNSQINVTNEPSNSPSAIYLGNFTIHLICKPERYNIHDTTCVNITEYELWNRHVSNLHAIAYVSNSLKQLIELVDSLTSASVPEAVSIGPNCCGLGFGWTSFSTCKITRKFITHRSFPPKFARNVACNAGFSHF